MTVALRAHHLLCTLTYAGKGYNAAFVANYDAIAGRIAAGECIRIVAGPDDVCAPLCRASEQPHCLGSRAAERDKRAARDLEPLIGCPVAAGAHLRVDGQCLTRLRSAFARGTLRAACEGCQWHSVCTSVALGNFTRARI